MNAIIRGALSAALLLAAPVAAFAHAHLQEAQPAAGSVLAAAPTAVSIHFTETLEPKFSSIVVLDASGRHVEAAASVVVADDPDHMTVALKPLAAGAYKVVWHATATDTHKTEGVYSFTVAPKQ